MSKQKVNFGGKTKSHKKNNLHNACSLSVETVCIFKKEFTYNIVIQSFSD